MAHLLLVITSRHILTVLTAELCHTSSALMGNALGDPADKDGTSQIIKLVSWFV